MCLKAWKTIRTAGLFVLFFMGGLVPATAQSWPNGYTYRRAITIDHTKIPNSDQSNFAVLFSGTYSYLATTGNGGGVTNANGYDIVFASDAGGTSSLSFERESYSASTGAVSFWVKVPTVSHSSDTVFYVFYGKSSVTTDQSNKTAVWDSNYKGIWHVPNGSTLSGSDSTSSANNGTLNNSPTAVTGKVGGGMQVNGQNSPNTSYLDLGNGSSLQSGGSITVSTWINTSALNSSGWSGMLAKETWPNSGYSLADNGPYSSNVYFRVLPASSGSCGTGMACIARSAVNDGNWHYLVGVYDGSTVKLYLDGGQSDSRTATSFTGDTAAHLKAGNFSGGAGSSKLDEVRFSSTARSADWIATEYNNQNSPSTFYSIGTANAYTYTRAITIDHTKVANSDQSNFPVLFSGTYSYLATAGNGGGVTNANGYDIVFASDAGGTSSLSFERESYSASTGAVSFWVKVPTVSHSSDTVFYVFYGNSTVTTDQSNKTSVWDSNYKAVWHVADNAANTTVSDSTSNGSTGTNAANTSTKTTSGKVSNALSYNGTSDYTHAAYNANLNPSQVTVEGWAYVTGGSGNYRALVSSRDASDGNNRRGYILYANSSNYWDFWTGNGGAAWDQLGNTYAVSLNGWTHVVATYDGTSSKIYINGVQKASNAKTYSPNTAKEIRFGAGANESSPPQYYFPGTIDEVRISNTARSADWIATEYNNQSSASTFYGLGASNAPSITSLSPTSGPAGTSVTITGGNFGSTQGSSTVTFNGTAATPTSWSSTGTSIAVPVPNGTPSGNVVVTVGGTASNGVTFTVPAPSITSLSPTSGPATTAVTITGTNFGSTQGSSTVKFNGTTATPTSWGSTGTSIGVPVPSGATTGNVVVTVAGAASNGVTFTVLTPTISSLSPTSGPVTTAVTITGTNFGSTQGSSTVKFNGTTATPTSWGSTGTSIGVPVPSGATTGNVVVTVAGAASNGVSFTVTSPTITSLTPTSGLPNAPVTIAGSSFGTSGTVTFNGTAAGVNTWSATSISVNVPSAATTGNVVVTVGGVASSGVSFAVQCPNVGAGVYYYFSDALGSSRVVTDSSGAVCNDSDYYPYGGERPIISSTNNHYKFTGKERDSESGLDNFGARYNSSQYGRFISPDPKMPSIRHLVNPQKWNKYAYVLNNPLSLFDPDGQEEITIVLRAFIPQKSVGGFKGDNRTFSSSPSGPDVTSRTTITISVETDPSKSGGNPMIGQPSYSVSPSTLTTSVGSWTKQGDGPQTATATYDANGNTVIKLNQDVSNPFVKYVPGQGIRSDLTTTIDPAGTNITTTGTVSGSPSFEENATVSNGTTTNVPLSTSSGNPAAFVGNLFRDKPVQKESCIKDKDNDTCR